jgi:hypothetical protein
LLNEVAAREDPLPHRAVCFPLFTVFDFTIVGRLAERRPTRLGEDILRRGETLFDFPESSAPKAAVETKPPSAPNPIPFFSAGPAPLQTIKQKSASPKGHTEPDSRGETKPIRQKSGEA